MQRSCTRNEETDKMLTREQYKKIKSMNRQEMDGYLNNLYAEGHNAGVAALSIALASKIDRGIRNTPGIGEKRYQEIMKNITEQLNKVDEAEQEGEISE